MSNPLVKTITSFNFSLSEEDFESFVTTSMPWGEQWRPQVNRFTPLPNLMFRYAYWFGSTLESIVAVHYLSENDYKCQRVFDEDLVAYVVLTNYPSVVWQGIKN